MKNYGSISKKDVDQVAGIMRDNINQAMNRNKDLEQMENTAVNLCKSISFKFYAILSRGCRLFQNYVEISRGQISLGENQIQ